MPLVEKKEDEHIRTLLVPSSDKPVIGSLSLRIATSPRDLPDHDSELKEKERV